LKVKDKISRSGSIGQRHGSEDLDPYTKKKCHGSTTLLVPLNCFLHRTGDREEEAVRLKVDLEKSEDNLRNLRMENGTLR
jgi:hypothetical protein